LSKHGKEKKAKEHLHSVYLAKLAAKSHCIIKQLWFLYKVSIILLHEVKMQYLSGKVHPTLPTKQGIDVTLVRQLGYPLF